MLVPTLGTALKEWKLVIDAMLSGRQVLLLRKGGIHERGGEFELDHRRFVFFPTYIHQNLRMVKPDAQDGFRMYSEEPTQITLEAAGEVTDIFPVAERSQIDKVDDEHVWTESLIDMRFNYKPENPLYLLLVRCYALKRPTVVPNTPAYAGCKSWVPLSADVRTADAHPVLDDANYNHRRDRIARVFL